MPVPHHRTRGQQHHSRGTLRGEQKSCGNARFCSEVAHKYTYVRVTRTGTYGPGSASLSGCIGLHLILYSRQRTATDRLWAMSHTNTPSVKNRNRAPLTARSSSRVCIGSRAPHCRTVLQNGQDKTPEASLKKWTIMEHSPGLPQDTKSLRSCSRNQAKMFLKGQFGIIFQTGIIYIIGIIYTPNITRSSDSFSSTNS